MTQVKAELTREIRELIRGTTETSGWGFLEVIEAVQEVVHGCEEEAHECGEREAQLDYRRLSEALQVALEVAEDCSL